ncbi:TPA: hypothetical protein ACT9HQ_003018, partial [Legionella pneumophila]
MDNFHEYWIGKGVDYERIWNDFNSGQGYINKFKSIKAAKLTFIFDCPSSNEPLFMHEAVYKSLKGLFHDFKLNCLTDDQYNKSTPMFLYSIERGSSEWSFLLDPALISAFVEIISTGFNFYSAIKLDKGINQLIKELNTEQIKPQEKKIDDFIQKEICQIIFENLGKLNPKNLSILD